MDDVTVNYYEIDGKDYIIMDELNYKNKKYCYLINELDESDHFIRIVKDDYLIPLDSEEELSEVLMLFVKKFSGE